MRFIQWHKIALTLLFPTILLFFSFDAWGKIVVCPPFKFAIPDNWLAVSKKELQALRFEIAMQTASMSEEFSGYSSHFTPSPYISGYYSPTGQEKLLVSVLRFPPMQSDYFETIKNESKDKIEYGLSKGLVTKILKNETIKINSKKGYLLSAIMGDSRPSTFISVFDERFPYQVVQLTVFGSLGGEQNCEDLAVELFTSLTTDLSVTKIKHTVKINIKQ